MKTFIIYGGSSELLSDFHKRNKKDKVINIYNKNQIKNKDTYNIKIDEFLKNFNELQFDKNFEFSKLIFLNVAALNYDNFLINLTKKQINNLIKVNCLNTIDIINTILPIMIKKNYGRLINFTSFKSNFPSTGNLLYASSKSFTQTLFKGIGVEYSKFNITSNNILIGFSKGKLFHSLQKNSKKNLLNNLSKNKTLSSSEITNAINFLIKSNYINSSTIDLTSGIVLT